MALSLLGVFVIATLVFCVLVVVMAALRPSVFSSFVREFTSKNTGSNEEAQREIKFINWKKGFFRLTLVLSILFGIFVGIVSAETSNSSDAFAAGFLASFGLTWLVYFMVGFVIRGFASKR